MWVSSVSSARVHLTITLSRLHRSVNNDAWSKPLDHPRHHRHMLWWGGGGASNGQVAVSAFGSGCACPTAVIAICPICQCSAEPQLEVCSAVHSSSLCPLAAFASWALQGYACIHVNGHSLPVVLLWWGGGGGGVGLRG